MAKISLNGVPDTGVAEIPLTLTLGTYIVPYLPQFAGYSTKHLAGGRTRVTAEFGEDAKVVAIIKGFKAGKHTFPGETAPEKIILDGKVLSIKLIGERVQEATNIKIDVGNLISAIDSLNQGDIAPLLRAVYKTGWTIVGRSVDDFMLWDPAAVDVAADILFLGRDKFIGRGGHDVLSTMAGNDILLGGTGNDELLGGKGKDVLKGGGGNDVLNGGEGRDSLLGGKGADEFIFDADSGQDVIRDFKVGTDRLVFNHVAPLSAEKVKGGTLITHDGGTIKVLGVQPDAFDDLFS